MQLTQSGSVTLPQDSAQALLYLNELLLQVQVALDELNLSFYTVTYTVPARPRDFMIRLADGTSWNPGRGVGLYQYYNGAWKPLWVEQWG